VNKCHPSIRSVLLPIHALDNLKADPEAVLRATNRKFERRFASIERALTAQGKSPREATLAEMDALWDAAKAEETK
jgi:nucleoside triphosphate diphosphatase